MTFRFPVVVEDVYYCYYLLVLETILLMQEIVLLLRLDQKILCYSMEVGTFGLCNVDSVTWNDVLGWMVAVGTL